MALKKFKLAALVSGHGSNLQAIIDSIERNELDVHLSLVLSDAENALALKRAEKHGIESIEHRKQRRITNLANRKMEAALYGEDYDKMNYGTSLKRYVEVGVPFQNWECKYCPYEHICK